MAGTLEERIADRHDRMSPAERRIAKFFHENRGEVLIASAAALAAKAASSDATVVRTAKALGYAGLDDLRRALADELRHSLSLADRLTRTLGEVGGSLSAAFETTLDIHLQSLENLRRTIAPEQFEQAVDGILAARRVFVFGLGPSSALASYLVIQLGRFGLDMASMSHSGQLFADEMQRLLEGDLVIILAYGRLYTELAVLLQEIPRRGAKSLLLTDTLAAQLRHHVDLVLPVARGRADMLSMHTATLGLIEALLVGVATRNPGRVVASLGRLNDIRAKLADKIAGLPPRDRD